MQDGKTCGCGCPHHQMVPLFIFLIGVAFLLQAFNVISASVNGIIWPILLILIGLQKMFSHMCKCCCQKK